MHLRVRGHNNTQLLPFNPVKRFPFSNLTLNIVIIYDYVRRTKNSSTFKWCRHGRYC